MLVLVTRPLQAGRRTAGRLERLGHEAVLAPVLRVEPTGEPPPPGPFDALVLTSANAVEGPALPPLPAFAVGARTAEAARRAGIGPVAAADGDGAMLAALVAARLGPGARLLHPCGQDRKPEPAASLGERGFTVAAWAVYRAAPVPRLPARAEAALGQGRIGAVLHYSRRSAAVLLRLAEGAGLLGPLGQVRHLCLSDDVAAPLAQAGLNRIEVAARPCERALLALLGPG